MRRQYTVIVILVLSLGFFIQYEGSYLTNSNVEMNILLNDSDIQMKSLSKSLALDVSEQLWNLTLGGSDDDEITAIANCSDGSYIMTGTTSSYGYVSDLWLIKVDQNGTLLWTQTFDTDFLLGMDVVECESGGFAIAGYLGDIILNKQMLLLRTDSDGNHLWNKTFGYTGDDIAYALLENSTGGFVLAGAIYESDPSNHAGILLWTDEFGNQIRNSTYTFGGGGTYTWLLDVIECSTGGFLTVGHRLDSVNEVLAIKTNDYGSINWYDYYGYGAAYSVLENSYGRYALCGSSLNGIFFKELNPDGSERRSGDYSIGSVLAYGNDIREHPHGGYVIVGGSSRTDPVHNTSLLRIDHRGRELWNTTLILGGSGMTGVYIAEDNSIIVAGSRDTGSTYTNGWILSMPSFYWEVTPEDSNVERDLGYSLDANTSMDVFTDTWSLTNSLLEVDEDGFISTPSPLPLGDHGFTLYVNDSLGRYLNETFWLHVEDNLAPQWITPPSDQEHEYGTIFSYDLQAIDNAGVTYWINDTTNFEHLGDGYIVSSSVLPLGIYPLRMNVTDSYDNMDTAEFTVTVSDTTSPALLGPQDFIKDYSTTDSWLQWTCSDLLPDYFIITRNDTDIESGFWNGTDLRVRLDGLALGVYIFHIMVNDTTGNTAEDDVAVFIADLLAPTIDHPADIWYLEGDVGYSLTWSPDDLFPTEYAIYLDGMMVETDDWDGSSITYSVDGLAPGVHNCTLVVKDINDNSVADYVQVVVIEWPSETTTTTTTTGPTNTTITDILDYIRGVEGAANLGLLLVGTLAALAIIVAVINIRLVRKVQSAP